MMKKYAFGVDVGGTSIKIGFFDAKGTLLEKWEIPSDTSNNGENLLPDIAHALSAFLTEREISKESVLGAGFGVPGAVLPDGTVNKCVNLGWGIMNVAEIFQRLSGLPACVGNDGNVAALGEVWKGGGQGCHNAVMITLGTGVGGGIIINGRIHTGTFGAGGEIGHIPMKDGETECCGCGKKGCLEQYSSANGLVRVTSRLLRERNGLSMLQEGGQLTAKEICSRAQEGDSLAMEAISCSMGLLGRAMAMISAVVDPEVYIIGGGLSQSGELILRPIREAYQRYAFHASRNTAIRLAELGNDAGIYGAVRLVMEET